MTTDRRSVSIALRSRGQLPPVVRFERAAGATPGVVSVRLEGEAVVVTFGNTAVVEATELEDRDGEPVSGVMLRDGPIEVAIAGSSFAPALDSGGPPARQLPVATSTPVPDAPTVPDAEWQAVDAVLEAPAVPRIQFDMPTIVEPPRDDDPRSIQNAYARGFANTLRWQEPVRESTTKPPPPARSPLGDTLRFDAGDTPTRIQLVEQAPLPTAAPRPYTPPPAAGAPPPPAPTPAPASVAAPPPPFPFPSTTMPPVVAPSPAPRIRQGVRRFALIAMLLATFMLWFRAHRAHVRTAAKAHAAAVASAHGKEAAAEASAASLAPRPAPAPAHNAGVIEHIDGPGVTAATGPAPSATPPAAVSPPPGPVTPGGRKPGLTRARAAADALANGDYPRALELYEELAADPSANPAYAAVVRNLKARRGIQTP